MFDDTNLELIPASAQAVAGYVNGRWPTFLEVVKRWPKAKHLSIAVTSSANADCLDVEPGDATNAVAPAWVKRQLARGVKRPVVYTSASNAVALLHALAVAGISRSQVRLWSAHYTGRQHICSPACGFGNFEADGTQWTDKSFGKSLDQSLLKDDFFGAVPAPKPAPKPKPKPVPPPPVVPPAPAPGPVIPAIPKGKIQVRLLDKDMQEHYELTNKVGFMRRAVQFAKGMYREFGAKRSL